MQARRRSARKSNARSDAQQEVLVVAPGAADQQTLAPADRQSLARAFGRLGDDRAVPVLTG